MPSLTLRDTGGGRTPAGGDRDTGAGSTTGSDRGRGSRGETRRTSGDDRGATGEAGRASDRPEPRPHPGRRRSASGDEPPTGRDASRTYPEFTFKRLAPRIDATRREEPDRRDVTYRDSDEGRSGRSSDRTDLADRLSAPEFDRIESPAEVSRLVEKLQRDIERRRRIERERRGL